MRFHQLLVAIFSIQIALKGKEFYRSASNKLPISGGFFQNNEGFHSNHFSRVKTKQKGMIKAKHLSLTTWKEFFLKSGRTENQEMPGNLPNIRSLFDRHCQSSFGLLHKS